MRGKAWRAAVAVAALLWAAAPAQAEPVRFIAFGDMPYVWPRDLERFRALIAAGNARHPDFMVHLGDIKSGIAPCTEENYRTLLAAFATSEPPLVYIPGDNEWTDCHRGAAGGYDPVERLALLRKLFFATPDSLGQHPMPMALQASQPEYGRYVENRRWRIGEVLFATLHVVGSNNGLGFSEAGNAEHRERMQAVSAWMSDSFAQARQTGAEAVVLFFHGDPLFEFPFPFRLGFNGFIDALQRHAQAFGKPVLIAHGDTHRLTLDRPLRTAATNEIIGNLVRLEVPGQRRIEGVEVAVDPAADPPFTFRLVPSGKLLTTPWSRR